MTMPEITLAGCTTEPLISYLKAVGTFRVVAEDVEHGDPGARCSWRGTTFVLQSKFDADKLVVFLSEQYKPTPIAVPWSGNDFFDVDLQGHGGPFTKAPTGRKIIEAFLASKSDRLVNYRTALHSILETMEREGVTSKAAIEGAKGKELKAKLLASLRSRAGEDLVRWIDAAAVIEEDRTSFNTLLGSGGGSDGNSHFSDNFMQHLWDVLPEFREQGSRGASPELLGNALFGSPASGLSQRSPALFSSGGVGGPNSAQGFEGDSLLNSWDFILALEGALCFAGAVTRKLGARQGTQSFPFSVTLAAAGYGTAVEKEAGQREIWFPVWRGFLGVSELLSIFSEGRAQTGQRMSRTGTDFARAIASYGVDAGLDEFHRFGFVKGRVGGENYTTAVPLGVFQVRERYETSLITETQGWLDRLSWACSADEAPPRFKSALRGIENAIFDFTRYGGASRLTRVLRAFGRAERELANGERFRKNEQRPVSPLQLSRDWVQAANDRSVEYRIAAALAGILRNADVGEVRENLEPVMLDRFRWIWGNGEQAVWQGGRLETNLIAILARRLMDSERAGLDHPAIGGRTYARNIDIAAFLWRLTNDREIEELLWGLALVDKREPWDLIPPGRLTPLPLPRAYALLKLAFLPDKLRFNSNGSMIECDVWTDPTILGLLRARDIAGAVALAERRLRFAGLRPMWNGIGHAGVSAERLAASLLIPVGGIGGLARMVIEKKELEASDTGALTEQEIEI
jgi:CRISPR-associated protein Csx17